MKIPSDTIKFLCLESWFSSINFPVASAEIVVDEQRRDLYNFFFLIFRHTLNSKRTFQVFFFLMKNKNLLRAKPHFIFMALNFLFHNSKITFQIQSSIFIFFFMNDASAKREREIFPDVPKTFAIMKIALH